MLDPTHKSTRIIIKNVPKSAPLYEVVDVLKNTGEM